MWHTAKGTSTVPETNAREFKHKVIQANLQRSKLALQEVTLEAQKGKIGIAMVQEPYVGKKGEIEATGGARVIQRTQNRTKPVKAAILIFDKELQVVEYPTATNENIAVATIRFGKWQLGIISVYFEGNLPLEPYMTQVSMIIKTLKTKHILLGGDLNAWSPWWGSDTEDHRGKEIISAFTEWNFHVINEGNVPTFFTVRNKREYKSNVDITASSQELLETIDEWKVEEGLISSDHNAITFTIRAKKSTEINHRKRI